MLDEKTSRRAITIFMQWLTNEFNKRNKEVEIEMEMVYESYQLLRNYRNYPIAIRRFWSAEEKARREALDEEASRHAAYLLRKHKHLCQVHANFDQFKFIPDTAEKLFEMMKFY